MAQAGSVTVGIKVKDQEGARALLAEAAAIRAESKRVQRDARRLSQKSAEFERKLRDLGIRLEIEEEQ